MTCHATSRRGHTLMELIVSVPLMLLLMVGTTGAIIVSSRSIPDSSTATSASLSAGEALDLFASDVRYATAITTKSATEFTFTVADRNGDAASETIRYYWSGVAGASFTRQVNGSTEEEITKNVQSLSLAYTTQPDSVTGLPRLRSIDVSLTALPGTTTRLDVTLRTLNYPLVP